VITPTAWQAYQGGGVTIANTKILAGGDGATGIFAADASHGTITLDGDYFGALPGYNKPGFLVRINADGADHVVVRNTKFECGAAANAVIAISSSLISEWTNVTCTDGARHPQAVAKPGSAQAVPARKGGTAWSPTSAQDVRRRGASRRRGEVTPMSPASLPRCARRGRPVSLRSTQASVGWAAWSSNRKLVGEQRGIDLEPGAVDALEGVRKAGAARLAARAPGQQVDGDADGLGAGAPPGPPPAKVRVALSRVKKRRCPRSRMPRWS